MSTNSRIAVMHGTVCKSIYCHWDGYLGYNGRLLQEHYDSAKANHLVALGDLSSLRRDIGEKHAFSQFEVPKEEVDEFLALTENMCTFYGRDRGETGIEFKVAQTFADFLEQCERCGAEYYYVMENGQWYYGSMHERDPFYKRLVLLSEALETEAVEA
jgi:hypothetical protein